MKLIILIFAILTYSSSFEDDVYNIYEDATYRLPNVYNVHRYKLNLAITEDILLGHTTTYEGSVEILFEFRETVDAIRIHAPFNIKKTILKSYLSPLNDADTTTLNSETDILTITSRANLVEDLNFTLILEFTGEINVKDMKGFYRSSYTDAEGVTQFLLTTQFQPTYARKAFPCFDEPEYKAMFIINLTYPEHYKAFSNTPQDREKVSDGYVTTVFQETSKMSTYLVAFVISKYTCTGDEEVDTGNPYQVCSRVGTESDREVALEYGPKVMKLLGGLFGINYKDHLIGKMDDIAIPDLTVGAMENYGIVTHRESSVLWNKQESSNSNRRRVITNLVHEYTHMWFGDLVTLNWWDNTFLNEGFARYFEYFATAQIPELEATETWEITKQFVVLQQQNILYTDGFITSLSLASISVTPSEVANKFSDISYSKGACILRMLNNFIGSENFLKGINKYLITHAHSVAEPSDLWNAIESATSLSNLLPSGISLGDVMDNWINKAGYPMITVSSKGDDVILTQKRFLYSGEDQTLWYVPVSYTTSDNIKDFNNVSSEFWLSPSKPSTIIGGIKNDGWIILNNQESSYYRVNYNTKLWKRIKNVLLSDHETIDVLNRAQIVDDIFNLAKAGEIKYKMTLNMIKYLENETEYYPWYAAVNGFNRLVNLFGKDSDIGSNLTALQLNLIQNAYGSVPTSELNDTSYIYTIKLVMIQEQACVLEMQECLDFVKEAFQNLKNGKSINNNLKHLIYCNGLKYSENIKEDWKFLWRKFETSSVATEQEVIVSALGCSKDPAIIKNYLNQAINATSGIRFQDIQAVWNSVITSNPENADIAFDYFTENYNRIFEYTGSYFLNTIVGGFHTVEQANKLETFLQADLSDSLKTAVGVALKNLQENLNWVASVKNEFEDYFNGNTSDDDDDEEDDATTTNNPTEPNNNPSKYTTKDITSPTTEDPNGHKGSARQHLGVLFNILLLIVFIISITN